ncbi:DUF6883 domain-containing protein [Kovacikia minuta]|uniref:DUF6883 domain-containing protein n=1 Tax=Kovacikia minuta TaxID=2931930 RepID=UPI0036F39BD2
MEPQKLINYLLNPEHPRGGSKAKLLIQFGYSQKNWQQLEADIRNSHLSKDVDIVKETSYETRYEIIAFLSTPVGTVVTLPKSSLRSPTMQTDQP